MCVGGTVAKEKISQTGKESKFRVAVVETPALFPRSPQTSDRCIVPYGGWIALPLLVYEQSCCLASRDHVSLNNEDVKVHLPPFSGLNINLPDSSAFLGRNGGKPSNNWDWISFCFSGIKAGII